MTKREFFGQVLVVRWEEQICFDKKRAGSKSALVLKKSTIFFTRKISIVVLSVVVVQLVGVVFKGVLSDCLNFCACVAMGNELFAAKPFCR